MQECLMTKFLSGCAAATLLVAFALPGAAVAGDRSDGVRNVDDYAWSSHRRSYRHSHVRRYYTEDEPSYTVRRSYRTYRSWDDDGAYHGYGYHRRPGVSVGVGGMGVHVDRW
jgi:hypothetical protein